MYLRPVGIPEADIRIMAGDGGSAWRPAAIPARHIYALPVMQALRCWHHDYILPAHDAMLSQPQQKARSGSL